MMTFDPTLVILSITIAVVGVFTAGVLTSGIAALPPGEDRTRIIMAILSLGAAIWAMHFVGLLAIDSPVDWNRNPGFIAASGGFALIGTAIAIFIVKAEADDSAVRTVIAAGILGLAVAVTNYLGLGAAAGRGLRLSWFLTLVNVALSIQVASLMLWFLFRARGVIVTLAGSVLLGFALAATHYMAVHSAEGLRETLASIPQSVSTIPERYLAWSTTIMIYLVCSICLCIYVIMQYRDEMEE